MCVLAPKKFIAIKRLCIVIRTNFLFFFFYLQVRQLHSPYVIKIQVKDIH